MSRRHGSAPIDISKEDKQENDVTDNVIRSTSLVNRMGGAWLANVFSRRKSRERKNITVQGRKDRLWNFVVTNILQKKLKTEEREQSLVPGDDICMVENYPGSFLLKAGIQSLNGDLVNCYLQMEKVHACKKCDTIFDDTNDLLSSLMKTKVEKIKIDGQIPSDIESYVCNICRTVAPDEDSMEDHLFKHIESKEVMCEECEGPSDEMFIAGDDVLPSRNLKMVRLLKLIASCKLCNKVISAVTSILPEVMTIEFYNDTYSCCECNCILSCNVTSNSIAEKKPLCESCMEKIGIEEEEEAKRTSWLSLTDTSVSEMFPTRHHPDRRHVLITDLNKPMEVTANDFMAKHVDIVPDEWYTCRFCSKASTNQKEMESHMQNHISFQNATCKTCKFLN